tara:strand:+ start:22704 stop:23273 length:570 start_codon:yes stop_codon:yes gene_type:complete
MTDEQDKANIAAALEHGVDVEGRRIFLQGDVASDSIAVAVRGLYLLADMADAPIELYVASYGGDIDEAFQLHDVTRTIKVPVHTTALGVCMSAAPFLVACGQKGHRYAAENTQFMMHTASLELDGQIGHASLELENTRKRCERMDRLLAKYTKKDYRFWAKFTKSSQDHYFGAEEALEWGIIDHIWSEK